MTLVQKAGEQIGALRELSWGWDGYGGLPVCEQTIRRVVEVLEALDQYTRVVPDVVPLSNGGVQLEWYTLLPDPDGLDKVEVEVEIPPSSTDPKHQEILVVAGCGTEFDDVLSRDGETYTTIEEVVAAVRPCLQRLGERPVWRRGPPEKPL